MAFVDVHAHLAYKDFEKDLDEVLERAKKAGVVSIIINGLNHENNKQCMELVKKYPGMLKAALGIYPTDAANMCEEEVEEAIDFIEKNAGKIAAIGECGLDYHHLTDMNDPQKSVFRKLISIAKKLDIPIIVHSRRAESDVIEELESNRAKKVVLHCFSGSMDLIKKAAGLGYYFSVPCNVVFSEHFQGLVKVVNINQLLTETDCPYLGPVKGERNEPKNVVGTVKKIAELKGFDAKEVENNILLNYKTLFE